MRTCEAVGRPEGPEHPFPIRLSGHIIKGFGRGSKEVSEWLTKSTMHGCMCIHPPSPFFFTLLLPLSISILFYLKTIHFNSTGECNLPPRPLGAQYRHT